MIYKDAACSCSYYKCCDVHKCICGICCAAHRQTKLCKWRVTTSQFMRKNRRAKDKYLSYWRLVRKNAKLKLSPSYFELTGMHCINVDRLNKFLSPRQRVMLNTLSLTRNLLSKDVIVDLGRCISKPKTIRADGIVPNLGRRCSRLLVSSVAQVISAKQCLLLQGVNPTALDLTETNDDQIFSMVGTAMCLPAIGTLLMACMSVMRW